MTSIFLSIWSRECNNSGGKWSRNDPNPMERLNCDNSSETEEVTSNNMLALECCFLFWWGRIVWYVSIVEFPYSPRGPYSVFCNPHQIFLAQSAMPAVVSGKIIIVTFHPNTKRRHIYCAAHCCLLFCRRITQLGWWFYLCHVSYRRSYLIELTLGIQIH